MRFLILLMLAKVKNNLFTLSKKQAVFCLDKANCHVNLRIHPIFYRGLIIRIPIELYTKLLLKNQKNANRVVFYFFVCIFAFY